MTCTESNEFLSSKASASSGSESDFEDIDCPEALVSGNSVHVQTDAAEKMGNKDTTPLPTSVKYPASTDYFVNLSISGTPIVVPKSLIIRRAWKLADVVQGKKDVVYHNGKIYVDADPQSFRWVLHYLRYGCLPDTLLANQLELESLRALANALSFENFISYIDGNVKDNTKESIFNQAEPKQGASLTDKIEELEAKVHLQEDEINKLKDAIEHQKTLEDTVERLKKENETLKPQIDVQESTKKRMDILKKEIDQLKAREILKTKKASLQRQNCIKAIMTFTEKQGDDFRDVRTKCIADIVVCAQNGEATLLEHALADIESSDLYERYNRDIFYQLCCAYKATKGTKEIFDV